MDLEGDFCTFVSEARLCIGAKFFYFVILLLPCVGE